MNSVGMNISNYLELIHEVCLAHKMYFHKYIQKLDVCRATFFHGTSTTVSSTMIYSLTCLSLPDHRFMELFWSSMMSLCMQILPH